MRFGDFLQTLSLLSVFLGCFCFSVKILFAQWVCCFFSTRYEVDKDKENSQLFVFGQEGAVC